MKKILYAKKLKNSMVGAPRFEVVLKELELDGAEFWSYSREYTQSLLNLRKNKTRSILTTYDIKGVAREHGLELVIL